MLSVRVDLLTSRYSATRHNDRNAAEWPPHPARFLAACLAAWADTDVQDQETLDVLRLIESAAPPDISVSAHCDRSVVTHYVPVNDVRPAANVAKVYTDLVDAEKMSQDDPRREKSIEKTRLAARERSTKESAPKSSDSVTDALKFIPAERDKQGRAFPTVIPDRPTFWFTWPDVNLADIQVSLLDTLLLRVTRVGHSSTLVASCVEQQPPEPTHRPDPSGDLVLRIPRAGVIDRWISDHASAPNADSRVLVSGSTRYAQVVSPPDESQAERPRADSVFGRDWFILERVGRTRVGPGRLLDLARSFKAAVMAHATTDSELITGHVPRRGNGLDDTEPTRNPHLAYVPLPFVGHPHADGSALGLAIIPPRAASDGAMRPLLEALGSWESSVDGAPLQVNLPGGVTLSFRRILGRPGLSNLKPSTWCRPSRSWISVTPVALDRVPGNMHDRDPAKRAAAFAEARAVVSTSCERIGLPPPVDVTIIHGSPYAGVMPPRSFGKFRTGEGKLQRILVHVGLRFDEPVSGPVLLGAGRFLGYGLCRPVSEWGHDA